MVDGPEGRFSWFYQNSASADDLQVPIVVGGANYGAPLENLRSAGSKAGVPQPFSDPALETFLQKSGVQVIKPLQYMDRWRLDRNGIRSVPNATVKKVLGF